LVTLDLEEMTKKTLGRRTPFEERLGLIDRISRCGSDALPYLTRIAEKSKDERIRSLALFKISAIKKKA